ncbi:MAG: hypothetical protein ABIJ97_13540 [Bacteroidota bacterium]
MEPTQDITLDYAAPIPLGHKIEVSNFVYVETDRKGREQTDEIPGFMVRDLTTGIEYGMNKHYDKSKLISFYNVSTLPLERRSDIRLVKKFTGTVARCRILTVRVADNWVMQTRLVIENTEAAY